MTTAIFSLTSLPGFTGSRSKFRQSMARTVRISSMARFRPGQIRGPAPKGTNACVLWGCFPLPVGRGSQRSGSKRSPPAKCSSLVAAYRSSTNSFVPLGSRQPSISVSSSASSAIWGAAGFNRMTSLQKASRKGRRLACSNSSRAAAGAIRSSTSRRTRRNASGNLVK